MQSLPQELTSNVLCYLSLKSTLQYAQTSKLCMVHSLTDLNRRRSRLSTQHLWTETQGGSNNLIEEWKGERPNDNMFVLPSVVKRLKCLKKFLSFTYHPLYEMVSDLIVSFQGDVSNKRFCCNEWSDISFEMIFTELKTLIHPFRLHYQILKNGLYSNPPLKISNGEYVVPLARYLGDVLAATILLGHEAAGLIEGGRRQELKWILRAFGILQSQSPQKDRALECYRRWVYLHSTVLRTAPLSGKQMMHMGLVNEDILNDLYPPGMSEEEKAEWLICQPQPCKCNRRFMRFNEDPLQLKIHEFGPLGPAYRGRDNIRIETTSIETASVGIVAFDGLPSSVVNKNFDDVISRWRDGSDPAISWMLALHHELKKARPMNVEPPLLTFQ